MNNESKNLSMGGARIIYLDVLRFFATIAVIILHVATTDFEQPLFSYNWYLSVIQSGIVRWAVPVFVMISGTLFLSSERDITVSEIYKKRIPRLLIAYFFWWFLYAFVRVLSDILMNGSAIQWWQFKLPAFHLWFLPILAGVYALIPFLRRIASDEKFVKYGLIIWTIYLAGSFLLVKGTPQVTQVFNMNVVLAYSGYFLFGYSLSICTITNRQRIVVYFIGFLGACITIGGTIAVSLYTESANIKFLNTTGLHVAMMASAVFVYIKEHAQTISKSMACLIDYVRKDLFGIYLTHVLWLMLLCKEGVLDITNHAITILLISLVIFVLSLYTTKLIRKIPLLRKVVE